MNKFLFLVPFFLLFPIFVSAQVFTRSPSDSPVLTQSTYSYEGALVEFVFNASTTSEVGLDSSVTHYSLLLIASQSNYPNYNWQMYSPCVEVGQTITQSYFLVPGAYIALVSGWDSEENCGDPLLEFSGDSLGSEFSVSGEGNIFSGSTSTPTTTVMQVTSDDIKFMLAIIIAMQFFMFIGMVWKTLTIKNSY